MNLNTNKNTMLLNKKVFMILFFLIAFFVFSINANAANFNYADFDFDKFAKENKNYWTSSCPKNDDNCVEIVLSRQRQYYTRLYKLLTKYQNRGYLIDDNIIIATTFYDLNPDLLTDDGSFYDRVVGRGKPYNYDKNLSIDDYDIDAEPDFDWFSNEMETLDLLIKSMFGYVSKCHGIYGDVVIEETEEGTFHTCPNGGVPTTVKGKYRCASTADSAVVGFWEYLASISGINKFLGLKNEHNKKCEELSADYPEGTVYEMLKGKRYSPETINNYWTFLETSQYFDKKVHLEHHFKGILKRSGMKNMDEFHEDETLSEEYKEDLILARKKIVKNIKSIIESRGSKMDTLGLLNISNSLYWWPIGGASSENSGGLEFAISAPAALTVSSSYGMRVHPTTKKPDVFHNGIDLTAQGPIGTVSIIAARSGIVETVVNDCVSYGSHSCGGGFGNNIIISHGDGNFTVYAHLHENTITVKKGDSVTQGQVIGKMGSSGRSTGPHLHFEIRTGSNSSSSSVNPLNYISAENPRAATFSTMLVEGNNNKETVCKTLLANGYSNKGTIGLMINAKAESSFNPHTEGDNNTSYGLFQWHKTRKATLMSMYRNTYFNIDSQISYLNYELENGYYSLYNSLKNGSESGDDLAYRFCVEFERPAGGKTTCRNRADKHNQTITAYVNNGCGGA